MPVTISPATRNIHGDRMACPYFLPTERIAAEWWPHPRRLPLGGGWSGACTTGGTPHDDELRTSCNLGYAKSCPHIPPERQADAVRFSARAADGRIFVFYIFEREYLPGTHGTLEFDPERRQWLSSHPDRCVQRMAECVVENFLARRIKR